MAILALHDHNQHLQIDSRGIEVSERYMFKTNYRIVSGVAVIQIFGVLWGRMDTEAIQEQIKDAINDERVHSIALDLHTPGGDIDGVDLTHKFILRNKQYKPIHAVVNTNALSSGYVIASACTSIILAGENARVGSIGTVFTHTDRTQALEDAGVKVTNVVTAEGKRVGLSTEVLTEEHEAVIQKDLDEVIDVFKNLIASGRDRSASDVESWANGNTYFSREAIALGLADTVSNMDDTILALALNHQDLALGGLELTEQEQKLKDEFDRKVQAAVATQVKAETDRLKQESDRALAEQVSKIKAESSNIAEETLKAERERVGKINSLNIAPKIKAQAIESGKSYQDLCVEVAQGIKSQLPEVPEGEVVPPITGQSGSTESNTAIEMMAKMAKGVS